MADQLEVNGNLHSWGSIIVKIDNERVYGFRSLKFGDAIERVFGYGSGRHHGPRGRSAGKYTPENVVLGAYPSTMQELRDRLAAFSETGTSYGSVEFEIVAQLIEPGELPVTIEIQRCRWAKNASSHEEGPDPLIEEAEFSCMRILRNGLALYDDSEIG